MLVKIKNLTGRTYDLDVEPTDTVLKVKQLVEQKEGISPEQQRLIFNAKPLFVVAARAHAHFFAMARSRSGCTLSAATVRTRGRCATATSRPAQRCILCSRSAANFPLLFFFTPHTAHSARPPFLFILIKGRRCCLH